MYVTSSMNPICIVISYFIIKLTYTIIYLHVKKAQNLTNVSNNHKNLGKMLRDNAWGIT